MINENDPIQFFFRFESFLCHLFSVFACMSFSHASFWRVGAVWGWASLGMARRPNHGQLKFIQLIEKCQQNHMKVIITCLYHICTSSYRFLTFFDDVSSMFLHFFICMSFLHASFWRGAAVPGEGGQDGLRRGAPQPQRLTPVFVCSSYPFVICASRRS